MQCFLTLRKIFSDYRLGFSSTENSIYKVTKNIIKSLNVNGVTIFCKILQKKMENIDIQGIVQKLSALAKTEGEGWRNI